MIISIAVAAVLLISGVLLLVNWPKDEAGGVIVGELEVIGDDYLSTCEYLSGGVGTETSPYLLEGLTILVSEQGTLDPRGISLMSIQAHLIIRNSTFDVNPALAQLSSTLSQPCGLFIHHSRNITIESCTFGNLTHGVIVESGSSVNIKNCSVRNCDIGIKFDETFPPVLRCALTDNDISLCECGIYVNGDMFTWNIDIVNNSITSCDTGISGYEADLLLIKRNRIGWCEDAAICLRSSSQVTIEENHLFNCERDGIVINDGRYIDIMSNYITVAGVGVLVSQSQIIEIEANEIWRSYGWIVSIGIFVDSCIFTNVTENSLMSASVGILICLAQDQDDTVVLLDNYFGDTVEIEVGRV